MSTDARREWLEQVAAAVIGFDRAMKKTISMRGYGGSIGPKFDLAQAKLRAAAERLDPARATPARLERIAELAKEMIAARREDGPTSFFYNDAADAVLKLIDLEQVEPGPKPELAGLEEAPALSSEQPGPGLRPSSLAEAEHSR